MKPKAKKIVDNSVMQKREYGLFLMLPLLVYPIWLGLIFIQNTLLGEQSLWLAWQYDAKSLLIRQIIQDYLSSLPWSYGVVLLLLLPCYYSLKRYSRYLFLPLSLFALLIGVSISFVLTAYHPWSLGVFGLTALMLILSLAVLKKFVQSDLFKAKIVDESMYTVTIERH